MTAYIPQNLATHQAEPLPPENTVHRPRTIAVAGGNGCGKTNFLVNLAVGLALRRKNVTVLNTDPSLEANAGDLLEVTSPYHIGHVVSGRQTLQQVIAHSYQGIRFIPGNAGLEQLADLSSPRTQRLVADLEAVEKESDFMFIDTPGGVSEMVLRVLQAASEVVVMVVPSPAAIVEAYATIKMIHKGSPTKPIWIVVNNTVAIHDGESIFKQLSANAARFLNRSLDYLGAIPEDLSLTKAANACKPVVTYASGRPASRSLYVIANHLNNSKAPALADGSFWRLFAGQ